MAEDALGTKLVDVLYGVHGEHSGHRAAHAKGTCVQGTFTATPAASSLSRAVHLQGMPVPVTARFSNGSGSPTYPDYARDGRGLSVKFHLPDGSHTDLVGLTLPVFFVRTPEDFLEFMRASVPTTPGTRDYDLAKIGAFLAGHPETQRAFELSLREAQPESYARRAYNGIHTFFLVDAAGNRRPVRYRWEPEAGEMDIEKEAARAAGRDYLQDELRSRMASRPVVFRLLFVLGAAGDPVNDPTEAWPAERESIVAGRLELTGTLSDAECAASVFDPTTVTDGFETSDDPILHARSLAYSVSIARRKGLKVPGAAAAATTTSVGVPSAAGDKPADAATDPAAAGMRVVEIDGERVTIASVAGRMVAFQDTCPHRGCSLTEGVLEGSVVTCPCHGSQFDVSTGVVVRGPAREPLRTRPVPADVT